MVRKRYTPAQKTAIVLELLKEEETLPQVASRHGVHPNLLRKWKAQVLEGLPKPVQPGRPRPARARNRAPAPTGRTVCRDWPVDHPGEPGSKKNLASNLARAERLALLERDDPDLSLTTQCDLLSLNRTSLYYQPVPPSPKSWPSSGASTRSTPPGRSMARARSPRCCGPRWSSTASRSSATCARWASPASARAPILSKRSRRTPGFPVSFAA